MFDIGDPAMDRGKRAIAGSRLHPMAPATADAGDEEVGD
jgi:hypothetical protein